MLSLTHNPHYSMAKVSWKKHHLKVVHNSDGPNCGSGEDQHSRGLATPRYMQPQMPLHGSKSRRAFEKGPAGLSSGIVFDKLFCVLRGLLLYLAGSLELVPILSWFPPSPGRTSLC